MSKKVGILLTVTGAVFLCFALLLLGKNKAEDRQAGRQAEKALSELETSITSPEAESRPDSSSAPLSPELPVAVFDGFEYVGTLELPSLDLKLPVMSEWDYDKLKLAPCRQFGSSRTDDLVIAAHNYQSHFGRLKELSPGDTVLFTDMEGIVNRYAVERTETLAPDALSTVLGSGCELVLYTCTPGGSERVAAFCRREA